MEKANFIVTFDKDTAENLKKIGLQIISEENGKWTFLNSNNIAFADENDKFSYTNKLNI